MEVQLTTFQASHSKWYFAQYEEQSDETFCSALSDLHTEATSAQLNANPVISWCTLVTWQQAQVTKPVLQTRNAL